MEMRCNNRRVIKGKNILFVTLPVNWTRSINICAGDELICSTDGQGNLSLKREIGNSDKWLRNEINFI